LKTDKMDSRRAFEISEKYNVPLHPKYTYFYHDVTQQDINHLIYLLHENVGELDMDMDLNDGRGNSGILNPDASGSSEENYVNGLTLEIGPAK